MHKFDFGKTFHKHNQMFKRTCRFTVRYKLLKNTRALELSKFRQTLIMVRRLIRGEQEEEKLRHKYQISYFHTCTDEESRYFLCIQAPMPFVKKIVLCMGCH